MFCYICREDIRENNVNLHCNHHFHFDCIRLIRKLKCPACRAGITGLPVNIMNQIKDREKADIVRRDLEMELAGTLLQLKIYEEMIDSITIFVNPKS